MAKRLYLISNSILLYFSVGAKAMGDCQHMFRKDGSYDKALPIEMSS
jgi:hypothetical protein